MYLHTRTVIDNAWEVLDTMLNSYIRDVKEEMIFIELSVTNGGGF